MNINNITYDTLGTVDEVIRERKIFETNGKMPAEVKQILIEYGWIEKNMPSCNNGRSEYILIILSCLIENQIGDALSFNGDAYREHLTREQIKNQKNQRGKPLLSFPLVSSLRYGSGVPIRFRPSAV